ncbi:MAG TPA: efflux RND transporter periplasmic adaptor subunit [Gammaproteobacteria bacterium]
MKAAALVTSLVLLLSACGNDTSTATKGGGEPAPHRVESATVMRDAIGQTITRTGSLRAEQEVKLITEEEGRIAALPFHEGDRVEKGELLVQLDDTRLRAELKKARAQRRQAELDLQRLDRLQRSKVVSEDELARARTALDVARAEEELLTIRLANTRIEAPFAGVISRRLAEPGDTVARFSHLLTLTATETLLAELSVSELHLPGLAVGDRAQIKLDALSNRTLDGTILRIHPTVDALTRQGIVEVRLNEPPAEAKPGQLCRVTLNLQPQPRLVVPFSALRRDTQGEYVFRIDAEQRAERVAVISGLQLGERIEIIDGLAEGDKVISNGFLGLSAGMTVEPAAADDSKS